MTEDYHNQRSARDERPPLLLNPVLEESGAYPLLKLDERRRALEESGKTLYDFGTGDPREPTDERIRQALVDAVPKVSRYPSVAGGAELREAFAGWMRRRHGVALDPGTEVLPANGSKEAIFHSHFAFLHPSHGRRGVVYGTPGYPVYERGASYSGGEPLPVELHGEDGFLLPVDEIDPDRTRILWINYPHNPTGAPATCAYLEEVADFCRRNDILLFSDECYNDVYSGEPPPSILEFARERTLAFCSLSKRSGMTGYRTAIMAGDAELISAMKKLRPAVGAATPSFVQAAAAEAWADDEHAEERRQIFGEKRSLFTEFFGRAGLSYVSTSASFYLWVEVPDRYAGEDEAYALRLLDEGIVVAPGSAFGPGGAGYIRVALVPTLAECRKAIELWNAI